MSTSHKIIGKGGFILEAVESSSLVSLELYRSEGGMEFWETDTPTVFDSGDLLRAALELVRVSSYISNNPEGVVRELISLIKSDSYLRSMERD